MRFLAFQLAVVVAATSGVCAGESKPEKFGIIHVPEVVKLQSDPTQKLAVYDANGTNTRRKEGIIPGAKLLSSSSQYNVAKELPADKSTKLVFYCANTH